MKNGSRIVAILLSATALVLSLGAMRAAAPPLRFVDVDKDGKLIYERDGRGNRIPDFSHAGYRGGGVPIPDVPVRVTVAPANGDDGARIQAAIDDVSHLPADERGFRGAVLLGRGRFEVAGNLVIRASGVVLRGYGCGAEVKLDLSSESGTWTVNVVNPDTGAVTPRSERVTAGRMVVLRKPSDGRVTFWLTRD